MPVRQVIRLLIAALLSAPLAWLMTFIASPFWGLFEALTGIESLGHSGPASWCFLGTYLVLLGLIAFVLRAPAQK